MQRTPTEEATMAARTKARKPRKLDMPPPIPDTPEAVAKAVLNTPPKKDGDWRYHKSR